MGARWKGLLRATAGKTRTRPSVVAGLAALGLATLGLAAGGSAAFAVPETITYTGELRADNGLPYTGSVAVLASLYAEASGGTAVWTADLGNVMVMNGILQVDLDDAGLPGLLAQYASAGLHLEFSIDSEILAPRQRLVSVPYATIAANAMMLGGMPASNYVTAAGLGDMLNADSLPTDGINQVSNGALRNKFLDESETAAGGPVSILDAQPSSPPPDAELSFDTGEGVGSYVTSIAFHTLVGLDFNSELEMVLTPPASAAVPAITLRSEFLTSGLYDEMWTVANTPALADLLGKQLSGTWTLAVRDLDNTAGGSPAIGALQEFEVMYDVVRADHLVVNGRLDVNGEVHADAFVGDGRQITGVSKILNVTTFTSTTRRSLPAVANYVLESFDVEKMSPTSMLIVQATISGREEYSDHVQFFWDYAGTTAPGQQYGSDNIAALRGKNVSQQVVFSGVTATGVNTMQLRWQSMSNDADRPFNTYNPNSSDDARLQQTSSTYLVWEIEQ